MAGLLQGQKAFITGGGYSVGRACVELFQQEGAKVAFIEINKERYDDAVKKTGALGYHGTMTDKAFLVHAIDNAAQKMGGLNILINSPAGNGTGLKMANAGKGGLIVELTDEVLDNMNLMHIKSYVWATQAAIPHMLKAGRGSIVQFGSVASTNPGWSEAYGIHKSAQTALAYQGCMEHAPIINSNALICGWMEHAVSSVMQRSPKELTAILNEHVLHRGNTFADLAKACLFLSSDLGRAINGELLFAEGGQTRSQSNMNTVMRDFYAQMKEPAFAAKQQQNMNAVTTAELRK